MEITSRVKTEEGVAYRFVLHQNILTHERLTEVITLRKQEPYVFTFETFEYSNQCQIYLDSFKDKMRHRVLQSSSSDMEEEPYEII